MATIRDVAKLAGVSIATVSRVLNRKGYVREETVKQVENAIEQLQYKLHAFGKGQYAEPSTLLVFLVDEVSSFYFSSLLEEIEQTAYREGYELIICNIHYRKTVEEIVNKNIAGILVTAEAYKRIKDVLVSIPYIIVEEQYDGVYEGARLTTKFLLTKGSRFLAFIKGPDTRMMNERLEAFQDIVEEEQIPYRIVESGLSVIQGELTAKKLLQDYPFIDAIFACNDEVAIGALRAAHILRITVPERLQIIGFGDSKVGEMTYPALSTVKINLFENMGRAAVVKLISRIKNGQSLLTMPSPSFQIVERESTK